MMKRITNQNGNVLFLIMIAIGLLGALMMTLSDSEKYSDTLDNETLQLELQEIYQYAQTMEKSVNNMLLQNGCRVGQLNFDHPDLANYDTNNYYRNTASPANFSCHAFEAAGGGVGYKAPPSMVQNLGYGEYAVSNALSVNHVGVTGGAEGVELILHSFLPRQACLKVNVDHNNENPGGEPPETSVGQFFYPYSNFQTFPYHAAGTIEGFINNQTIGVSGRAQELQGKRTGCYYNSNDDTYNFYHVLLAR